MTENLKIYTYHNSTFIYIETKRDNLNNILLNEIEQIELLNYLRLKLGG